jgi:hypothetical protein
MLAGDQLPDRVVALHAGDVSGAFATDGVYWWAAGDDEKAPRTCAEGQALSAAVAADIRSNGLEPVARVCICEGPDCLVEGVLVDASGEPRQTFVQSFQLDGDGAIRRAISLRCPPVEPSASWETADEAFPHSARAVLGRYFGDLDASRLEAAAASFSPDTLYSHPPYFPGAARSEFRGRDELNAGFVIRGSRPNVHELCVVVQRGRECMVEGYSHRPGGESAQFISSLSLDGDGLIRRYTAVVFGPAVGRV